ncbi:hypothetical protein [Desulfocurvibacter africanus]|uniref:Uncharacterized protein n=1 Tax=Desulfocurvibacter africanus subsp. africanus str. Walvis Bay TaxID=690850 RepID=F3YVZ6_DESAF|nr:hypothetical protein [Desulfocurvibacter africanus]EGJ49026.1 hypothetical protein Desaf_0674 [Desulfocurvibacter africanus subsp. africanus str. Walvis Bay]
MRTENELTSYRVHRWFDTKACKPVDFGIQAIFNGHWVNLAENGKALLFDLEYDACAKILELKERDAEKRQAREGRR